MNDELLDPASIPFSDYIRDLANLDMYQREDPESGMQMCIEKVEIEMPFEIEIQFDLDGNLLIGANPPVYYLETSVMPTFHRMKLNIEANPER